MALGRIDQFSVIRLLGHGGMGDVYLARDTRLDCDVALKVLREERASDPAQRAHLLAEARALAQVDHPNVVGILGCGEARPDPPDFLWPGSTGPHPASVVYLAMRHVQGTDLRTRIAEGPIALPQAVDWAVQILRGLDAAHAHGVVHRDLKPGNIRISPAGEIKLLDFGLASSRQAPLDSSDPTMAVSRDYVLGTVGYTSPEQFDSAGHADPRCDLFSAGVILYEMVTGTRPFKGRTMFEVLRAIARDEPPPLSHLVPDAPAELERITARLLQKDPQRRPPSARAALTDLEALAASLADGGEPPARSGGGPAPRPFSPRAARAGALAAAAVTLAALLLFGPCSGPLSLRPRARTVAVTAIENATGSPAMDLVAAGLTQDLLVTLAERCRVNVVESRLRDSDHAPERDPKLVGREYGASSVLLGALHLQQGAAGEAVLSLNIREVRVRDQVTQWARDWNAGPRGVAELRRGLLQTAVAHWPRVEGAAASGGGEVALRPAAADEAYLRGLGWLASADQVMRGDSSLAEFDRALAYDPAFARAYAGRARSQVAGFLMDRDSTRLVQAERDARRAVELDLEATEGHLALAMVLQHRGRTREAVDQLRAVVARNDQGAETFKLLGEAYANVGDLNRARRSYATALELQPSGPKVWRSYGTFLLLKAADLKGAESAFRREVELSPERNQGHEDLAVALIQQCRYAEAVAEYEERPEPGAQSLTLFANRGVALFFTRDYEGAMRDFLEAVKISPENGRRRLSLGDAYQQLGRDEDALREYREARQLLERDVVAQGDNVELRATYAMSLAKSGDFERALAEVERCESAHVERQADGLHVVAKTLALCGERGRALDALRALTRLGYARCRLQDEPEFASLRGDPAFRKLMSAPVD